MIQAQTQTQFQQQLCIGQTGESWVAKWLIKRRGYSIMPVYDIPEDAGKVPRVFCDGEQLVAPDMFAFRVGRAMWIEAKSKSAFTWHRKTKRWTTGIDLRHYRHYLRLQERSDWPVILAFLHFEGIAKDTPVGIKPPTGLFINKLEVLAKAESHRHEKSESWAPSGMVFWAVESLVQAATLEDVLACR